MIPSDYQNTIAGMTSPFDIHQPLEDACYAFVQKSLVEVHEIVNLFGIQDITKSTELLKDVRVTLHKIKRQAGIFGSLLVPGIARVAEK